MATEGAFHEEGARVRAARALANWTQTELAEHLEVRRETVALYEKGHLPRKPKARERLLLEVGEVTGMGPWVAYGEAAHAEAPA